MVYYYTEKSPPGTNAIMNEVTCNDNLTGSRET